MNWRWLTLGLAVASSLALVALPATRPTATPTTLTLAAAWPDAAVVDMPAQLADGGLFSPVYQPEAGTSVGTAPTPDSASVRLLVRSPDGTLKELHRVPAERTPQFGGFTADGDTLVWVESTTEPDGPSENRLWRANWRTGGAPVSLTTDLGDAVFFNSQYDLVLAENAVHWVAVARTAAVATEVRGVPLTGGRVTVRTVDGAYAMSGWPWLVSAGTGQNGPVTLRNLTTDAVVTVPAQPTELVTCAPDWCRVLVLGGANGPLRLDLMHPDGTGRQRVAGGDVSASVTDVAVLGRYEVLSRTSYGGPGQELLLYDVRRRRTVTVASGVGLVLCRGGVLWWSTGDNEALRWHTLDLRTLP